VWESAKESQHFQEDFDFGSWNFINVPNLWKKRENNKPSPNWHFFKPLNFFETLILKVGLHFLFGDLKFKLWPNEWLRIKLTI
jgi:hypothetical protein